MITICRSACESRGNLDASNSALPTSRETAAQSLHLRDSLRWAALARELWAARGLWSAVLDGRGVCRCGAAKDGGVAHARIKVYVRLKPRPRGLTEPSPQEQRERRRRSSYRYRSL
jgi:hypothetical protein